MNNDFQQMWAEIKKLRNYVFVSRGFPDVFFPTADPRGITPVGSDRHLMCSLYTRSIVQVNVNSGKVTVILEKQDGIVAPRSPSFCPKQRKLFLCSELYTKDIHVYLIE